MAELAKLGPKPGAVAEKEDPLGGAARHLLSAGKVLRVWARGAPTAYHVLCTGDWRTVVWQDVSTQRKVGALDLRLVARVAPGTGPGHKPRLFGAKVKDPDACFCIVAESEEQSLALECANARDAKAWVEACTRLVTTFKTAPQLL